MIKNAFEAGVVLLFVSIVLLTQPGDVSTQDLAATGQFFGQDFSPQETPAITPVVPPAVVQPVAAPAKAFAGAFCIGEGWRLYNGINIGTAPEGAIVIGGYEGQTGYMGQEGPGPYEAGASARLWKISEDLDELQLFCVKAEAITTITTTTEPPAPECTLTADPFTGTSPLTTTLSWTTKNAVKCEASGGVAGWPGAKDPAGGSQTFRIIVKESDNFEFRLKCENAAGAEIECSDTVSVERACEQVLSGGLYPVQVVYAEDTETICGATPQSWPDRECENDLDRVSDSLVRVKATLPMVRNKPTGLVGFEEDDRIAKVRISAGPEGLWGRLKIQITGAEPDEYTTKEMLHVDPCQTEVYSLNPHDEFGAVTAIPFVPGTREFAEGISKIRWEPLEFFKFGGVTKSEITLKFDDMEQGEIIISKTVVEKVQRSVPFSIRLQPLILAGEAAGTEGRKALDSLVKNTNRIASASSSSAYFQANYPLEDGGFSIEASPVAVEWAADFGGVQPVFLLEDWQSLTLASKRRAAVKLVAEQIPFGGAADRIIIIVPGEMLFGMSGWTFENSKIILISEPTVANPASLASSRKIIHEVGHALPWSFSDDWIDGDRNIIRGQQSVGVGYLATWLEPFDFWPARPVSGGKFSEYAVTLMHRENIVEDERQIIRKDRYKHLAGRFETGKIDPPVWLLRGVIERDGAAVKGIEIFPIYELDGVPSEARRPCNGEPDCITLVVQTVLRDGTVTEKELFVRATLFVDDPIGQVAIDFAPITDASEIPPEGIERIVIRDTARNVLFTQEVSDNPPELEILLPAAGATLAPTEEGISIEVSGVDVDGDPLHASFFVKDAEGNSDSLERDVPVIDGKAEAVLRTDFLEAGEYTLRVILTDGFNTVEEEVTFVLQKELLEQIADALAGVIDDILGALGLAP